MPATDSSWLMRSASSALRLMKATRMPARDARIHLLFDVVHIEPAIVSQQHFRFLAGADIGPFRFFAFDEAFRETDDFIRRSVAGQQTVRTERAFGKDGPEIIKGKASVQDILIQVAAQDEACARVGMLQHLQLER